VKGTEYYAVASAQAMQADFPEELHGGGCRWECRNGGGRPIERCEYDHPKGTLSNSVPRDGCSCVQKGSCMCGKAGSDAGEAIGTAPMGCFTCGRGQFLQMTPYDMGNPEGHVLIGEEVKVVVADVCPYGPNYMWCPAKAGEVNAAGAKNHLDFATPPPGRYNNNFFVFTVEPCSEELMQRMRNNSSCPESTFPSPGA